MSSDLERLEQAWKAAHPAAGPGSPDQRYGSWAGREPEDLHDDMPLGSVWEDEGTAAPAEPGDDTLRAHARACAAENGPPARPAQGTSPVSLDDPRALIRAHVSQLPVIRQAAAIRARMGRPGTLLSDAFGPDYRRHRECAEHCRTGIGGGARMLYGYLHMAIVQGPLDYFKWATRSPLSLVIHVLLALATWLGLLLGGYL